MPLGKWAGQLEEIRTPSIGRLREFVCYENIRRRPTVDKNNKMKLGKVETLLRLWIYLNWVIMLET